MEDVTLQPRTISTVKATAPVLREHDLEITQRMYELLFQDEQIKSLFNQSTTGGSGASLARWPAPCTPTRPTSTASRSWAR